MKEVRIIVAGSRDFADYELLKQSVLDIIFEIGSETGICYLNKSDKNTFILAEKNRIKFISGTARGADSLGEKFANECGYKVVRFPADWDGLGKRAGYVRNAEMAKYASEEDNFGVLIAFWDGKSKGTKHMIDLAKKYGLEVHIVNF
jgi:hypothetical protein